MFLKSVLLICMLIGSVDDTSNVSKLENQFLRSATRNRKSNASHLAAAFTNT